MTSTTELRVDLGKGSATTALLYGADGGQSDAALVLAHGAGAGQRSAFMIAFGRALADLRIDTVTFNFPYTEQGRRLPDRRLVLEACYRAVILEVVRRVHSASIGLFVGGKSMGGRIATHLVAADPDLPIDGIVLLGYPLHPPGRPDQRRDAHLTGVARPMLFVQGSRDGFGTPAELAPVLDTLSPHPALYIVEGGDHSFKTPTGAGALASTYAKIQRVMVEWMRQVLIRSSRERGRGTGPPPR